jgi:hypothetical protein
MRKDELRNGMVVETRKGILYLVVGDFMTRENGYDLLSNYDEDMINVNDLAYDIVKVYEFKNNVFDNNAGWLKVLFDRERLTLLWERKEYNLTEREVEVLEALQTLGHEWLVRDKDNRLFAYKHKPSKRNMGWFHFGSPTILVDEDLFTFIKWEDKEPTNIKELLK